MYLSTIHAINQTISYCMNSTIKSTSLSVPLKTIDSCIKTVNLVIEKIGQKDMYSPSESVIHDLKKMLTRIRDTNKINSCTLVVPDFINAMNQYKRIISTKYPIEIKIHIREVIKE